jgi:hypothetical protein
MADQPAASKETVVCPRFPSKQSLDFLYLFKYTQGMPTNEHPLVWLGSSHKDLMTLPADIRRFFGFALSLAQSGDKHDAAKVLKGFGGAGVLEVVEDDVGGTYRSRPRKTWPSSTPG